MGGIGWACDQRAMSASIARRVAPAASAGSALGSARTGVALGARAPELLAQAARRRDGRRPRRRIPLGLRADAQRRQRGLAREALLGREERRAPARVARGGHEPSGGAREGLVHGDGRARRDPRRARVDVADARVAVEPVAEPRLEHLERRRVPHPCRPGSAGPRAPLLRPPRLIVPVAARPRGVAMAAWAAYLKSGAGTARRPAHWTLPLGALVLGQGASRRGSGSGRAHRAHSRGGARARRAAASPARRRDRRARARRRVPVGGGRDADPARARGLGRRGGADVRARSRRRRDAHVLGAPRTSFARDLVEAFIYPNLWLIALNLIPVAPLDGARPVEAAAPSCGRAPPPAARVRGGGARLIRGARARPAGRARRRRSGRHGGRRRRARLHVLAEGSGKKRG